MWAIAVIFGTGVIVAPWTIRNYFVFHRLIPVSTNDGTNMWIGNNPQANGAFFWPRDPAANPLIQLVTTDEVAAEELGRRLAVDYLIHNPERVLGLLGAKVFYLYNSNDRGCGMDGKVGGRSGQSALRCHDFRTTESCLRYVGFSCLNGPGSCGC